MTNALRHPVFRAALEEIESLGVQASDKPISGATPYAIVGGRSNARWWLIPLTNRQVAMSGLAMFQPILASAKLIKQTVLALSRVGLQSMWAKPALYLAGTPSIARHFGGSARSFAYFTGTDSPHRKLAVQAMHASGRLAGFAKVTRNPLVNPLLRHEADTLGFVNGLGLTSAKVPRVLFSGEAEGSHILVTDTLKTTSSVTSVDLQPAHVAFLKELANKGASPAALGAGSGGDTPLRPADESGDESASFRVRFGRLEPRLPPEWSVRLTKAIDRLAGEGLRIGVHRSLAHGDFTPWNTFFVDDALYVFDWEYAQPKGTVVSDLIHFVLASPRLQRRSPGERVTEVQARLERAFGIASSENADSHLMRHLVDHTLRYVERSEHQPGQIASWDGMRQSAELLDLIIGRRGRR